MKVAGHRRMRRSGDSTGAKGLCSVVGIDVGRVAGVGYPYGWRRSRVGIVLEVAYRLAGIGVVWDEDWFS